MSTECFCGHYSSEHTPRAIDPVRRCRVRYGTLGDSAFLDALSRPYERCDCPGFEVAQP